jgi:replicative DNA helicase
MTFLNYR